jgi:hypothetical protein
MALTISIFIEVNTQYYFKSDFFSSNNSLWNFLPAFVNQISPSSYSLRDKMDQRDARSGIKLRNVVVAPEKG